MNKYYTSLELSKKLKEGGCELESKEFYGEDKCRYCVDDQVFGIFILSDYPKAYDILWDICIKYAKEFWGEELWSRVSGDVYYSWEFYTKKIFSMLQQGESQEKVEKYIWENCLFNKDKKK